MLLFSKLKNEDEYKHPLSVKLTAVVATIGLIAGIICFLIGISENKDGFFFLYIGLGSIFSSLILFAFADMAENTHLIEIELSKVIEDNRKYQDQIISLLQTQQTGTKGNQKPHYLEPDDNLL